MSLSDKLTETAIREQVTASRRSLTIVGVTRSCVKVDTFTVAGHDTTGVAVTYAMFLIGHHPAVQDKLHAELDDIFGDDRNRDVTKEDISRMSYTEAVIKETLRLYPSSPGFYRTLTEDLVLSDKITLPTG